MSERNCADCVFGQREVVMPCPSVSDCFTPFSMMNRKKVMGILIGQLKEMKDEMAINKLRTPMFLKSVK